VDQKREMGSKAEEIKGENQTKIRRKRQKIHIQCNRKKQTENICEKKRKEKNRKNERIKLTNRYAAGKKRKLRMLGIGKTHPVHEMVQNHDA
jgi:hypothetical protein